MNKKRTQMKKRLGRFERGALALGGLALVLAVLAGCSLVGTDVPRDATSAEVSIVSDPEGGTNVPSLSCTFEVTEIPGSGSGPVVIRASWAAPCGVHKSESFTFSGGSRTFVTTYEEPGGYPLNKTFWVVITWEDGRGSHTVRSEEAECVAG